MAGVISGDRIRHTPQDEKVGLVDIIYSSKSPTAPFIAVDCFLLERECLLIFKGIQSFKW